MVKRRLSVAAIPKLSARCGIAWLLCSALACAPSPLVRVSGGRSFEERAIDAQAYAAYIRGKLFESKGDTDRAIAEYQLVLSRDPLAAEAVVHLAALHCSKAPNEAKALWERAERLDPESTALWLGRARCELANGRAELALRDATWAARFGTLSNEAIAIILAASSKLGQSDAGFRWLRAALAAQPNNAWLWQLMFEHERASNSEKLYAASRIAGLHPVGPSALPERLRLAAHHSRGAHNAVALALDRALNAALQQGNLDRSRTLATALGINPEQLAQLALHHGAYAVAADEAQLLLSVNPDNAIAWATALLAADFLQDPERFASLTAHPPKLPLPSDSQLINSIIDLSRRRAIFDLHQGNGDAPTPNGPRAD